MVRFNRFLLLFVFVLCFTACHGSQSNDSNKGNNAWHGNLLFERSACDIVVSQPPDINPATDLAYLVSIGTATGDPVLVTDFDNNNYKGAMTGLNSFEVFPDGQAANPATMASSIQFSDIANDTAHVSTYFTRNAPHGCTHYFSGTFRKATN